MEFDGPKNSDLFCLLEENIYDIELIALDLKDKMYFSVRQSLHMFVTGLKVGMFVFKNFQEMVGW